MTITQFPDTAYEIISLLSTNQRLSQDDIGDFLTDRHHKEIKYAIRRLHENGVIQIEPNLLDMRSSTYRVSTEDELEIAEHNLSGELFDEVIGYIHGNLATQHHPALHSAVNIHS